MDNNNEIVKEESDTDFCPHCKADFIYTADNTRAKFYSFNEVNMERTHIVIIHFCAECESCWVRKTEPCEKKGNTSDIS